MKICKNCKVELEDNQKFCHCCGSNESEVMNNVVSESAGKIVVQSEDVIKNPQRDLGTSNKKKIIIWISSIVAILIVIIAVITAVTSHLSVKQENAPLESATYKRTTTTNTNSEEKESDKFETSETENDGEYYDSIHWEKVPENSEFHKNYIAYSYKMGPGTFIDKINSIGKMSGLSFTFKWTGDLDMNGYTRRIFTSGGYQDQKNIEQEIGYYFDIIEDDNSSYIMMVTPFVGRDYTGDTNQALATLIVMALYAYDEIPIGNEFSVVMDKILAGDASFRYNNFIIVYASNDTIYANNIFKSSPSLIRELESVTDVKLEDYS